MDRSRESCLEEKMIQENILLDIIKEVCADSNSTLSPKLVEKIKKCIADCDLSHHSSLHTLSSFDESTSTLFGIILEPSAELTFEEQNEFNQAIINKIQNKLPKFTLELEKLKQNIGSGRKSRKDEIIKLQYSLNEKLNTLKKQENEKVELMMEWLDHRLQDVSTFTSSSVELLMLKSNILELKSKIMHLQILRSIFTETNQSVKAYSEVHKDLEERIKETEQRIKNYKDIIESDFVE